MEKSASKFFDVRSRSDKFRPVNIFIGGRGIGKTYSTLDYILSLKKPFIYLRNTDIQISESASVFGNPFKRLNLDKGYNVTMQRQGKHYVINDNEDLIGYGVALSTVSNLRGVDLSDVAYIVFDEFIELRRLNYDQFRAFVNFYETVNRNRESAGEAPLICFLLSNSQMLGNPILSGFDLIPKIERMLAKGKKEYLNNYIHVYMPTADISEEKKESAIYKLTEKSKFYKEAIQNEFAYDNFDNIKKPDIKDFKPLCAMDDIYIYRHKAEGLLYISDIRHSTRTYSGNDEKLLFLRTYGIMLRQYKELNKLIYSSFKVRRDFEELLY